MSVAATHPQTGTGSGTVEHRGPLAENPQAREKAGGESPDAVRDLYRRYPYPPLEPNDNGGLDLALLGTLDYVRHVFWPGRQSLAGLRVLDAGCGTGITAVQIARDYPEVDVTAIDISEASLELARQRAARQRVGGNLTFRLGQIEDLPPADPNARGDMRGYDYIVSSGVLHHLADPVLGARRLAALLTPTGGMAVMLYATYGRSTVYVMQDLLRRLGGDAPLPEQVTLARAVLAGLPSFNPFMPEKFADLQLTSDAGLVDLLLHPRDRSYTVTEVFDLIDASGLRLERFLGPARYLPETYIDDPGVKARVAGLPEIERHAIAELLHGAIIQHTFFATRPSYQPMRLATKGLPLLAQRGRRSPLMNWPQGLRPGTGVGAANTPRSAPLGQVIVEDLPYDAFVRRFDLDGWNLDVVASCDGALTGWQVFDLPHVQAGLPGATRDEKLELFGTFLQDLATHELLLFEP